jgi:hypothetical protein
MGLRAERDHAIGLDGRQLGQRLGRGVVHALIGLHHQRPAPPALDPHRYHPRPLERPVVGQGVAVLLVAVDGQLVELVLGHPRLGRHR